MVHGIDAVRGIALPKPVAASLLWYTTAVAQAFSIIQPAAASLLWYTTAAAQAFSIIQTLCRVSALVHTPNIAGRYVTNSQRPDEDAGYLTLTA